MRSKGHCPWLSPGARASWCGSRGEAPTLARPEPVAPHVHSRSLTLARALAKDARFRGARPEWSRVGDPLEATQNGQNLMIPALLPNYARADLAFERGEGAWLWTVDGRRFLDFGSGIATASLGHGHPHLTKAIAEQAAKVMHTSNLYRIPQAERLAQRLVDATFADSVFFCNSGAEANEGMIKMMRRAMFDAGKPERFRFICFEGNPNIRLSPARDHGPGG